MHRAGVASQDLDTFIKRLEKLDVKVEGILTHFARADDDMEFTE